MSLPQRVSHILNPNLNNVFSSSLFNFQSLIRTAEQLKIKGLCEINDHTNTESDSEVVYPPHKKSRTSRQFESNSSTSNNAASIGQQEDKRKSKNPQKETTKNNFSNQSSSSGKNMASLEMGMVRELRYAIKSL